MQKQKIISKNVSENFNLVNKRFILILMILTFLPITILSYPVGWSKDTLLHKEGSSPKIFSTDQILGITFLVKKPNETSVYFKLSYDNGKTWNFLQIRLSSLFLNNFYLIPKYQLQC